jgi:quinol monooxygenase YgiN
MDSQAPAQPVMTVASAVVAPDREAELMDGFRAISETALPDGLLRTELLRGQHGTWRVQSLWRDRAALEAVRLSGQRPAALELFERVGADHSHDFFFVEQAYLA